MTTEIIESEFFRHVNQSSPHLMWLLGAGASRSSGLPTATDITWDLKRRIYCAQQNQDIQAHDVSNKVIQARVQNYMDSQGFPSLWDAREYSFYFEQYFGEDYSAQQKYLREALSTTKVTSTIGQRALAALLGMGRTRLVFTTNFDEVVESTYANVTGRNLSTFHIEGAYAAMDALNADQFPLYVKLHGDFRYQSIKNLPTDLLYNDQHLQKCFIAAAARFGAVIAGYSGRDENVMSMLREAIDQNNAFPHGLFWTAPRISSITQNVHELIAYAQKMGIKSGVVQAGTFDEMLSKIWRNTTDRTKELDEKVRTSVSIPASIPLPPLGNRYPMLRTNALRIISVPEACGTIECKGDIDIGNVRSRMFEERPDCTLSYTDRLLFWGDRAQIEKVIDTSRIQEIKSFSLGDLVKQVDESGTVKAFIEEAFAKAVTINKPLHLRKSGRDWYAVVNHEYEKNDLLIPLRRALGFKETLGHICGKVASQRDVFWAEAVSLRIEERNGSLWLLLRPDIWISPLQERQNATDFLRQRKIRRWNGQSFQLLSAWIQILLGEVGGGSRIANVTAHPDSQFSAPFQVSTRSAYSKRSAPNGSR